MWVYRLQVYSTGGTYVTECRRTLLDEDYDVDWVRAIEEQVAERMLRSLEGVTPDTPLVRPGWTHFEDKPRESEAEHADG